MESILRVTEVGLSNTIRYIATASIVMAVCEKCGDSITTNTSNSSNSEESVEFFTFPIKHIGKCGKTGEFIFSL